MDNQPKECKIDLQFISNPDLSGELQLLILMWFIHYVSMTSIVLYKFSFFFFRELGNFYNSNFNGGILRLAITICVQLKVTNGNVINRLIFNSEYNV